MSKERQDVRNATKMAATTSHQVTQIRAKGHSKEDERGRYLWDEAKEGNKEVSAYSTRLLCESPTSRPTLRPKGASWEHCEVQTGNQTDAEDRDDAGSATWHEGVVHRRKEINAPCLVVGLLAA